LEEPTNHFHGLLKALSRRGYDVSVFHPASDGPCSMNPADFAGVKTMPYHDVTAILSQAEGAKAILRTSAVVPLGALGEDPIHRLRTPHCPLIFWDLDAGATLAELTAEPAGQAHDSLLRYDAVLSYGAGDRGAYLYRQLGVAHCHSMNGAIDSQRHCPVAADERFAGTLTFLEDRDLSRSARVEEFFFSVARRMPDRMFVLAGDNWNPAGFPSNVRYVGSVEPGDYNALYSSGMAVLNLHRAPKNDIGVPSLVRLLGAAAAAACVVSDPCEGVTQVLEPASQLLLATTGAEVEKHLRSLTPEKAGLIGRRARQRALNWHTFDRRVYEFEQLLERVNRRDPRRKWADITRVQRTGDAVRTRR